MSVYFDASVLVALFAKDPFSERATNFVASELPAVVLSDFAAAELASAIARRVRMRDLRPSEARLAFANFDNWATHKTSRVQIELADTANAEIYLRRLDLPLRTGDALNIAAALRVGAALATFDAGMARSAAALGASLVAI